MRSLDHSPSLKFAVILSASDKKYAVVIIGSGPAGIVLSRELEKQGVEDIAVIESGGLEPNRVISGLSSHQVSGDLSEPYYLVHSQRQFGGTSNIWTGLCAVLEQRAFKNSEWPIRYDELSNYYGKAARYLELPHRAVSNPYTPISSGLNYRPFYLSTPVRFGPKHERFYRSSSSTDLILYSTVSKLIHENGRITGALTKQLSGENDKVSERIIRADRFILAGGSITNANLLNGSDIGGALPIGKGLMDHPHSFSATEILLDKEKIDAVRSSESVAQCISLSDDICLEKGLGNFSVSFDTNSEVKATLGGETKSCYRSTVTLGAEMTSDFDNTITRSDELDSLSEPKAKINFKFKAADNFQRSWEILAHELAKTNLGRANILDKSKMKIWGAGHIMGTTRMGRSPNLSVVDANCKVHSVDNLFVAGSSVFPAGGAANPTLTIAALSIRLADHLVQS